MSRDFRIWRGLHGKMKRLKMKNVALDSEGSVFSTARGDLRLVLSEPGVATWAAGHRHTRLKVLPIRRNLSVIFSELGVYFGQQLGTPCDDL